MFGLAHSAPMELADTSTLESGLFAVKTGLTLEIPYQTKEGSIKIKGFTQVEGDTAEAGKFAVKHGTDSEPKTTVTFFEDDCKAGDEMRVAYRRRVNGASTVNVLTNSRTATGELSIHWPVYSSGTDAETSSVKGYLHVHLPRVRVSALPGFDVSYKSAGTNSLTFGALNPRTASERMYSLTYEPLDSQGGVVTTPSTGATGW